MKTRSISVGFAIAAFSVAVFLLPHAVFAASLYLAPAPATVTAGQTFVTTVYVSSPEEAMNAVSGDIAFPSDKLRILSVSQENSIVNFWVQTPSFSNATGGGDVSFEGVVLSPGFSGAGGNVLTITFQALNSGNAPITFSSGSILADDGSGTNILSSMQGIPLAIIPAAVAPSPAISENQKNSNLPAAPIVSSPSNPNQNQWYNAKNLQLSWPLPSGITGVSYALYATPNFVLPSVSNGMLSNISYDLSAYHEGTWYFYIKFQNANGWGPATVWHTNIDFTPPEPFAVDEVNNGDLTNPQPTFTWNTSDALSGLDKYLVKIGNGDWFNATTIAVSSTLGEYQLPLQAPSDDIALTVDAYDKAGNVTTATTSFRVAPLPPITILAYSEKLGSSHQLLSVRGNVRSSEDWYATTIYLYLKKSGTLFSFSVPVDQQGNWNFSQNVNLPGGSWVLIAQATDDRGALSISTSPVLVSVSGWLGELASFFASWAGIVAFIIILFGIIMATAFGLIYGLKRWRLSLSRRLLKDRKELRDDLTRIEKELGMGTPNHNAVAAELRKKQEMTQHEIEHLEKDIRKDIKDLGK